MSHYHLKLFIETNPLLKENYAKTIANRDQEQLYKDAGFDLFCPGDMSIPARGTTKIDHDVRCSMVWVEQDGSEYPVAFYLYLRSSTGAETPLRLANSFGTIDSGYRGPLIAAFDNHSNTNYEVVEFHRLVQICPPDLSNYPLHVSVVESAEELGITERG